MQESPFKGKTGLQRLWNALGYSLHGLASAFRHEDAFRQECLLAAVLIPAAFFVHVGGTEKAIMVASVLLVLIIELLNCSRSVPRTSAARPSSSVSSMSRSSGRLSC
jgi:diacylglycerol kinase (ATP)